jgi:hypothetical protein
VLNSSYAPALNNQNYVYGRDMVNPAPNFGFAWNPQVNGGILGKLNGGNKTVIGASYALSYYNEGINAISNLLCCNQGTTQSVDATAAISSKPGTYNLTSPLPPFATSPASFAFPLSLTPYPLNGGNTLYYANPNLRTPYVQNWNLRIQRELARNTVFEVRYIGNKSTHVWHYQNVNEVNIFENSFLQDFKNAQGNLAINLANGKGSTFANNGLAGQTALPIFQAAFGANGSNPALSASQGFGNSTFITNLQQGAAGTLATSLATTSSATYYCRMVGPNFAPCAAQGFTTNNNFAQNFWRPNPYANNVYYQDDNGNNNYNGLQIELRKAFSHGLTLDTHYTWSHTLGTVANSSDQTATYTWWTLRNGHLNYGPTPFDHRHTYVAYWTYDLPVGHGKWLNLNNRILNGVLGDWTVGNTDQIISGAPILLTGGRATFNNLGADGGVVFGNGLTLDQLLQRTSTMTPGYIPSCTCFKTNVSDMVQANGSPNPAYYSPGQTPGVIGPRLFYTGKTSFALNMSLTKRFRIKERYTLGFYGEASNFLNHPFFGQGNISVTSTSFGNITSASGNRTIFIRGYLDF